MITSPAPAWRAYTGQSDAETMGQGWIPGAAPGRRLPALIAWRAALITQSVFEHQSRVRGSDGYYRGFAMLGVPVRGASGSVREWMCVFTEIENQAAVAALAPLYRIAAS